MPERFLLTQNNTRLEELQSSDFVRFKNIFNPSKNTFIYDDFTCFALAIKQGSQAGTGAGVAFILSLDSNHNGVLQVSTGTTATGWCSFSTGNACWKFSTGTDLMIYEAVIRTDVLSTALQEYVVYWGLGDNCTVNTEPVNGAYFKYVRTTSVNYQICTANGGTRTITTTSTAVPASTFVRFKITILGNTLASFYIDNVLLGTISTNIPTANPFGAVLKIVKTVGTTARQWYEDYIFVDKEVTR